MTEQKAFMRLMTYNILDGAADTLQEIIEVVKKESPDYLTLNEANTFAANDNKVLKDFARETNFPYFDIALSGEYDYHVAVLSKYPFKSVHKLQPLARACLIALIDSPLGEISIASLHLTPYSEDLRHPEIDLILDFQQQYPHKILMGDMNSLSKNDKYDEKIIADFNETQIKKFTSNGKLRFDAIEKILSTGYQDSAVLLNKNNETTVPTPSNNDSAHAAMRLDYIFLSSSLSVQLSAYEVVKNERTNKASDHYPVIIDFN